MALHTMAYQADVLKEMDEGTGLTPEAVKELRRATDRTCRRALYGGFGGRRTPSVAQFN